MVRNEEELKSIDDFLTKNDICYLRNYIINSPLINSLNDIYVLDEEAIKSLGFSKEESEDKLLTAIGKKRNQKLTEEEQLEIIFKEQGYEKYIDLLKKEKVFSINILKSITETSLKDIGIDTLGERLSLMEFISQLTHKDKQQIDQDATNKNTEKLSSAENTQTSNVNQSYKNTETPHKSTSVRTIITIIIVAIIIIIPGLWGYGYVKASGDLKAGISLIGYRQNVRNMNPITQKGYTYYFENNSNMRDIEKELNNTFDNF